MVLGGALPEGEGELMVERENIVFCTVQSVLGKIMRIVWYQNFRGLARVRYEKGSNTICT